VENEDLEQIGDRRQTDEGRTDKQVPLPAFHLQNIVPFIIFHFFISLRRDSILLKILYSCLQINHKEEIREKRLALRLAILNALPWLSHGLQVDESIDRLIQVTIIIRLFMPGLR
jgi:hypothetical protein